MCPDRDARSVRLPELIMRLAATLSCVAIAYLISEGLPPFLQMDNALASVFFLCLSIVLICEGILYVIRPFTSSLSKIFVRGKEIFGYGCISVGAGFLLLLLNGRFAISPALPASFVAFVIASVLLGIDATRLAVQLRAVRRSEKDQEDREKKPQK